MARRLRPLAFADLARVAEGCSRCSFWETAEKLDRHCGAACDADRSREWFDRVTSEWGECGRVAYEDNEVLGFVKYAPSMYFPQAATFPSAPLDGRVPLIACLHVAPDARHHGLGRVLLLAALRDLVLRGEKRVEAFGYVPPMADIDVTPMLGIQFLLRHGFTVSRPDPTYPLLQLELRSLAVVSENLEAILESLRLPMPVPQRSPVSWT